MSAEETLYAALNAGSPANAVVAIVADRIYPIVVPHDVDVPAIAYQRVNTEMTNSISAELLTAKATFDIFCVAAQFKPAEDLANAVKTLLSSVADEIVVINRTHTFDADSNNYAVVLTVDVWE